MRTRRNTYAGYSIGCAGVWAVIVLVARRRLDSETRIKLWLTCIGWWSGWTSATIGRIGYPPPKNSTIAWMLAGGNGSQWRNQAGGQAPRGLPISHS